MGMRGVEGAGGTPPAVVVGGYSPLTRRERSRPVDLVLLSLAIAASFVSTLCFVVAVGRARQAVDDPQLPSYVLALLWMAFLVPWSWGLVVVAVRAYGMPLRRRIPRLALALVVSVPSVLVLVNIATRCGGGACPRAGGHLWAPDVVQLIYPEHRRPELLALVAVPLLLAWRLLLDLPSVSASTHRRRIVHLGLVASLLPLLALSVSARVRADGLWALGSSLVVVVLLGIAGAMATLAQRPPTRLVPPFHELAAYGAPAAVVAGAGVAGVLAVGGSTRVFASVWLGAVGYLVALFPVTAFALLLHDHLVVGGSRLLLTLASAGDDPGSVQELLRRGGADPGLRLLFEREGGGGLVDVSGRDARGVDDATLQWVEVEGERVAGILWSPDVGDGPARAAPLLAVAALSLRQARLQARLTANLVDLRATGRRLVEAQDRGRRAVQRELREGPQQHLVALRSGLVAEARTARSDEARALARRVIDEVDRAVAMTDELARGIYPGSLARAGLRSAVEAFVSAVPIEVHAQVTGERFPRAIEEAAYLVVSESVANVVRHARVPDASVGIHCATDELVVEVADDGRGGARVGGAGGLVTLTDRVRALGGTLTVVSPDGGGTVVRARIPAHDAVVMPIRPPGRR